MDCLQVSSESVAECLELLTSVNTAENATFSVVVPSITPQTTPVSSKVRFGSSHDLSSGGHPKRKSPRFADNLHKSILKAVRLCRPTAFFAVQDRIQF